MRTPHLATSALAVAAAMMGGSGGHTLAEGNPMELTFRMSKDAMYLPPTFRSARNLVGRVAKNQQQRRKDRRRAHAAGCKKAFA